MSVGDVLAVVAAVVVAMLVGALVAMCILVARALRDLRGAIDEFRADSADLLDEMGCSVRHAEAEVDRVDRLVTAAEAIEGRVDSASRLAYRTLSNPVVKAMAFGAGVSRASRRLRGADHRRVS